MIKENYIQQLLFIDKKLEEYTLSDMHKGLSIIDQKNLMLKKLQEIKKEIKEKPLNYFLEYEEKSFEEINIDPSDLYINKTQNNLDNKPNTGGRKITDFLRQYRYYLDVRHKLDFVINHFEFFAQNLPIIVEKSEDKYYIKSGNHRSMAVQEIGLNKIKVILLK